MFLYTYIFANVVFRLSLIKFILLYFEPEYVLDDIVIYFLQYAHIIRLSVFEE